MKSEKSKTRTGLRVFRCGASCQIRVLDWCSLLANESSMLSHEDVEEATGCSPTGTHEGQGLGQAAQLAAARPPCCRTPRRRQQGGPCAAALCRRCVTLPARYICARTCWCGWQNFPCSPNFLRERPRARRDRARSAALFGALELQKAPSSRLLLLSVTDDKCASRAMMRARRARATSCIYSRKKCNEDLQVETATPGAPAHR